MKVTLAQEDPKAEDLLPPTKDDGSGVGINYVDAYLKSLKVTLDDGTRISCKRRGLKLTLKIGEKTGTGLLRRLDNGPDEKNILRKALEDAARDAGARFEVEDGIMSLELD